ncbi:hypothetical protein QFZ75_000757 [Streptomyces sp. V3I8]|uniref:hypothetical protein n=1 Tax=Streptomyces sp. V3I8 TaxID=3042279 RepID=UPI00278B1809|nr:hypothetical protein [Streptomyces sp. V3I8]MDQ1034341.1 hypothetical protein [Streptomyces sp. V3I8]
MARARRGLLVGAAVVVASLLATNPSSLVAAGAQTEVKGRAAQGAPKGSKVTPEPAT